MDNILSHLPKERQADLTRIVDLIKDLSPADMIILFGSHARGDWVSDVYREGTVTYEYKSDYDILVIVADEDVKGDKILWRDVEKNISKVTSISINLLVDTINFVNKKIKESNYFYLDIKNEGIILYDSYRFVLASPVERSKKDIKMDFEFWQKKAKAFYKDFEHNLEDKEYNNAAFHLSQVTESLYFAVLLVFMGYKPKTHNIENMATLAEKLVPTLVGVFPTDTEEQTSLFELLRKAYIDARYRQEYKITFEQLDYLNDRVKDLFERVENACKEKIASS